MSRVGMLRPFLRRFDPGIPGAPAVANGLLYFNIEYPAYVYALNAADGTVRWTFQSSGGTENSLATAYGEVFVGTNADLWALSAATGSLIWQTSNSAGDLGGSPSVVNGVIYTAEEDGRLHAYSAATGTPLWSANMSGTIIVSTPAVNNGGVYIGTQDHKVYGFHLPG